MRFYLTVIGAVFVLVLTAAPQLEDVLSMERVMTADELKSTGVSTLSAAQRKELDGWLVRYTLRVMETKSGGTACDPVIDTRIDGDFNGWEGETVYKLRNGQIWQQASYHYHYHYAYSPEVTIYPSSGGCSMVVTGDDDQPIPVRRLK